MTKSTEPSTPSGSSETQQRRRQITSYKNTTTSPATDSITFIECHVYRIGDMLAYAAECSLRTSCRWYLEMTLPSRECPRWAGSERTLELRFRCWHDCDMRTSPENVR